ncbi:MAG: lipid-A-disaccharide synthase [bacterium]
MKYYIIAGEASGDMHAANLMRSIRKGDPGAQFRVWGGDRMEAQGGTIIKHYRDLAFMGFVEVLINLRTILGNIKFCKQDIVDYQPDVVILVDYPGFNLRIARFAKNKGFKVIYYISPQVWAWKKSRVKTIRKYVDRMIVILPFEKDFYAEYGMDVDFVGHPLLDALESENIEGKAEFLRKNNLTNDPIVALLPGSRKMEVEKMLKIMLQVVPHFPVYQFAIAGVSTVPVELYERLVGSLPVKILIGQSHDLLYHADAALVTSGTATLETALIGVPEVVCYKGNRISFEIAKRIVDVKYISLVNLVMDRQVVTELIQQSLNEKNLKLELDRIINDENNRSRMLSDYGELRRKLGETGASKRAADIILSELSH